MIRSRLKIKLDLENEDDCKDEDGFLDGQSRHIYIRFSE